MTSIAVASDLHGMWAPWEEAVYRHEYVQPEFPKADVIVLAGDILANYSRNRYIDAERQIEELKSLDKFIAERYGLAVMVAGNHDWCFQILPEKARKALSFICYLENESAVIDGIYFYGAPQQPYFCDWAFNFPDPEMSGLIKAARAAIDCWAKIDEGTEILVTHSPAYGVLDTEPYGLKHCGCPHLADRIDSLKNLEAHVFGHIHWCHGERTINGVLRHNAAICNEQYEPLNPIRIFNV